MKIIPDLLTKSVYDENYSGSFKLDMNVFITSLFSV